MARREKTARIQIGAYAFTTKGISRFDLRDPYYVAVTLTWPQFLAALLGLYLSVNLVFATLYVLVPGALANARHGSFEDAFFFSFETLATVGYGEMYPATLYGHIVASAEIVCGLAFTAILTGLTFVRFSRPRAKFMFADHPVVAVHNGKPTLMIRIGNGRAGVLADARARVNVLLNETSTEGSSFRRTHELLLIREHLPILPLSWTLIHEINEQSPMFSLDSADLIAADARLFVSIEARDPSMAAMVYDVKNYRPDEVAFGMRYSDAVTTSPEGGTVLDLSRISAIEPDSAKHGGSGGLA